MADSDEGPWDLVVVGGGAAGFFGAITAAESLGQPSRILILEKSPTLLAKVKISGGGRCNVTHACYEAQPLSTHYPRGEKELLGPLHHWGARDTENWFHERGIALKTESDGRVFPTSDDSQTIVDCLMSAAQRAGVVINTKTTVSSITPHQEKEDLFYLRCADNRIVKSKNLLLASGGTRSADSENLLRSLKHSYTSAVPSLFTFNLNDEELAKLAGLSVKETEASIPACGLKTQGPVLITHWGLSGPAILKLSALGARLLHGMNYRFELKINWLPGIQVADRLEQLRKTDGKRLIFKLSPFAEIPRRLWEVLVAGSDIGQNTTWSQLSKSQGKHLVTQLTARPFQVLGKSTYKEEFVTCGGVQLAEINFRTMESRIVPGLYFAGEILDIDGITGGFNFQNAWTTGHLAGTAIAKRLSGFCN